MPTRTTAPRRPRRGPPRSPLAAAPHSSLPPSGLTDITGRAALQPAVPEPRLLTLAEFRDYLRTVSCSTGTSVNTSMLTARAARTPAAQPHPAIQLPAPRV